MAGESSLPSCQPEHGRPTPRTGDDSLHPGVQQGKRHQGDRDGPAGAPDGTQRTG